MDKVWARLLTPRDLGDFVADLRVARHLTQRELADQLGVHRQYITEIETGKHTLHQDRLFALLRLLGARLTVEAELPEPADPEAGVPDPERGDG